MWLSRLALGTSFQVSLIFLLLFLFFGCAAPQPFSGKELDPEFLLENACAIGRNNKSVKGSVWLKAHSSEASGQFPAWVQATSPDQLRLEITHPLGGTEAVISVHGKHFEVDSPRIKGGKEVGYDTWAGIPLQWSNQLFLGRIPCPPADSLRGAKLLATPQGVLTLITSPSSKKSEQKFVYHFKRWEGHPWPDSLHWEQGGVEVSSVDFSFDDPEDQTKSPTKWEAKSARGDVKVRWRSRDVTH